MGIIEDYSSRMEAAQDERDKALIAANEEFGKAAESYHAHIAAALVAFNAAVGILGREAREAIHGPSSEGHGEPATAVEALCYHEPAPPVVTFTRTPGALPKVEAIVRENLARWQQEGLVPDNGIDGVTHVEDYAAPVDAK